MKNDKNSDSMLSEEFNLKNSIELDVGLIGAIDATKEMKHFRMKSIIYKSKESLDQFNHVPPEVGELLVNCLYNYLEKIGVASADSGYILDALHLAGKCPSINRHNMELLTIKFCEGFHEKACSLPAQEVSQEKIWERLVEYKKKSYDPEEYFYLEGYYLALSGKKSISGAAYKRLLTAYLRTSDDFHSDPFPDSKAKDRFDTYLLKEIIAKDLEALNAFKIERIRKHYLKISDE